MTSPDAQQPVFLQCKPCGFAWIGAYLPMPMGDFARLLKRATCPKCGQRKQVYLYEPGKVPPPPQEPAE
jgi:DNA-directed RNA polymerase subunit M/transcription elongation factor TFIIS